MAGPLDEIKEVLGKRVRVVLDDDRVIDGALMCLDKDLNLIIDNSTEWHSMLKTKGAGNITFVDESITKLPSRHLGMAMVPGKNVVGIMLSEDEV